MQHFTLTYKAWNKAGRKIAGVVEFDTNETTFQVVRNMAIKVAKRRLQGDHGVDVADFNIEVIL